jgi:hypothetical protein
MKLRGLVPNSYIHVSVSDLSFLERGRAVSFLGIPYINRIVFSVHSTNLPNQSSNVNVPFHIWSLRFEKSTFFFSPCQLQDTSWLYILTSEMNKQVKLSFFLLFSLRTGCQVPASLFCRFHSYPSLQSETDFPKRKG